CISILQSHVNGYLTMRTGIQMDMTHEGVMQEVHHTFGGSLYTLKRPTITGKRVYKWLAESHKAAKILTDLLPYLLVKRPQALIALEFQKTISPYKRVSEETWILRKELRNQIALLNDRTPLLEGKNLRRNAVRPFIETGCPSEGLGIPCLDLDPDAGLEVQTAG